MIDVAVGAAVVAIVVDVAVAVVGATVVVGNVLVLVTIVLVVVDVAVAVVGATVVVGDVLVLVVVNVVVLSTAAVVAVEAGNVLLLIDVAVGAAVVAIVVDVAASPSPELSSSPTALGFNLNTSTGLFSGLDVISDFSDIDTIVSVVFTDSSPSTTLGLTTIGLITVIDFATVSTPSFQAASICNNRFLPSSDPLKYSPSSFSIPASLA